MKEYIVRNAEIRENGCGGYLVVGDTERFGDQEILFESPFKEECEQFLQQHTETVGTVIEREFALTVWFKGTNKIAWKEEIKTMKTERDLLEEIEGNKVNTEMFYYRLEQKC